MGHSTHVYKIRPHKDKRGVAHTPSGTHTKGSSNAGTETVEISCARHVSLGRHDTLSMTAMCISNPDGSPVGINR